MNERQPLFLDPTGITMLGLGAMGSALAAALVDSGAAVTVWNRTPGRTTELESRGASAATSVAEAVTAHSVVASCLLRHDSVHETLDSVVEELRGRTLVNLTTTTPNEARELASWAAGHSIGYLDAAVMAVPAMIGSREAQIFYSGSREAYDYCRPLLDVWATGEFRGDDPGLASLLDLAMLSAMYSMLAGLTHGAAMMGTAGVSATDFAARAVPFVSAMTPLFARAAEIIDGGDYTVPGAQSLEFSDLSPIVRASEDQGVDPVTIAAVQSLISRQLDAGHGAEAFERIYESLRADVQTAR